jgi:hypothetical protein
MASSKTVTDIIPWGPGLVCEYGTWIEDDAGTAVTITAATTGTYTARGVYITDIRAWGFASDGDHAVDPAADISPKALKITVTTADTGDYYLIGAAR